MLSAARKHTYVTLLCLVLVYISWGSVFIANKIAVASFPPFMMCFMRMASAGFLLYILALLMGERGKISRKDFTQHALLALSLVLVGSGFLIWGQEMVSSSTAAIISGSAPVCMVLGDWLVCHERRPRKRQFLGLATGFIGLLLLSLRDNSQTEDSLLGIFIVFLAIVGWVAGSLYSKRHQSTLGILQSTALLMFLGGLEALVVSLLCGEFSQFSLANVTRSAWIAYLYLIFAGALVGYTCYVWLLYNTPTVIAISYEYVNPVIGVVLGGVIGGEHIDSMVILSCSLIVGSVVFVVNGKKG